MAARSPLPPLILMTDDERLPDPLRAARALPRGSMVIVRARDDARRRFLAQTLLPLAQARGLFLFIAGDVALALALGADGVHLPEARIGEAAGLRARHRLLVTASAHSFSALRKAAWVDALLLSPVFPTASHPGRPALGPLRASAIARAASIPVYALGGVTAENATRLSGFSGIAAIGALAA
jgi:thiamine-phosphate pyrophosphorylase